MSLVLASPPPELRRVLLEVMEVYVWQGSQAERCGWRCVERVCVRAFGLWTVESLRDIRG